MESSIRKELPYINPIQKKEGNVGQKGSVSDEHITDVAKKGMEKAKVVKVLNM